MRASLLLLSAGLIATSAYACSSSSDGPSTPGPGGADASADGSTNVPIDVTNCDAVVRVRPDGNDAACPKKTIAAALAAAKAAPDKTKEIQVCAGTYNEHVVLDVPVSLSGGYACADFKKADGNETVLTSDDPETLLISGAAVGSTVKVEGLTVRAGASANAVLVKDGAKPILSNLQVFGSETATATSAGIRVTGGAAPEIEKTKIDGGKGASTTAGAPGSIGLVVEAGAGEVKVRESDINGGRGSAPTFASLAVHQHPNAPKLTIEKSTLDGGAGTGKGNAEAIETASTALYAEGTIELFDSGVHGGKGTCTNASAGCRSAGVFVVTKAADNRFERNRIYAGDAVPAPGQKINSVAISVDGPGIIANNLVHLGGAEPRRSGVVSDYGISIRRGQQRLVAHNTIVAVPNPAGTTPPPANPHQHYLIEAADEETKARIINNVLLGTGTIDDYGVYVNNCVKASLLDLRANLFIGFPNKAYFFRFQIGGVGECNQEAPYAGTKALEDGQNGVVANTASANFRLAVNCGVDNAQQCLQEPSCFAPHPGCIPKAVSFDGASFGVKDLNAGGWKPTAGGAICNASTRSIDLSSVVNKDFTGATRTKGVTIGAHELDACP